MTIEKFFKKDKSDKLNIEFLLKLYNNIDVKLANMVLGVNGFTTHEKIYINTNTNKDFVYYVALHELAHYKRIKKLGIDIHMKHLSSNDFDEFAKYVINEEIIADRYANLMFYIANGYHCNYSQELECEYRQEQYKSFIKVNMFNLFSEFSELEDYKKLGESLLV